MSVLQRVRKSISELIGYSSSQFYNIFSNRWRVSPTVDITSPDAAFWDKARRAKAQGLTLSGLLLKPITSKIAAWAMGELPDFTFEDAYTQDKYADWFSQNHPDVLLAYEESLNLGKLYVLCQPHPEEGVQMVVLPPDTVTPIVDPENYARRIGYRVVSIYPHPEFAGDYTRIEEEYYADRRIVTTSTSRGSKTQTYRNPTGRVPIVHVANNRGVNETEGRPETEALLELFQHYDDVMHYAIAGNKRQGRPTPVIVLGSPTAVDTFREQYGRSKTKTNSDGTTETYIEFDLDLDELIVLAEGSDLKFVQPGSFMGDVTSLTQLMYYLTIEHTELPEFLLGSALSGSKASAETQMPPFVKFIEKKQGLTKKWLAELALIVTSIMSLYDTAVQVVKPTINFAPMTDKDGRLTLDAIQVAYNNGWLDDETALRLLPLDIDNPAETLERARKEAEERKEAFDSQVDSAIQKAEERLSQQDTEDTPQEDSDVPVDQVEMMLARLQSLRESNAA